MNITFDVSKWSAKDMQDFYDSTGYDIEQIDDSLKNEPMRVQYLLMSGVYWIEHRRSKPEMTWDDAYSTDPTVVAALFADDDDDEEDVGDDPLPEKSSTKKGSRRRKRRSSG